MNWRRGLFGVSIFGFAYAALEGFWAREAWVERSLSWRYLFKAQFGDILIVGMYAVCSIVATLLCVYFLILATED